MKKALKGSDFQKALKDAGFRVTMPRLAILDLFSKGESPMNAETVHAKLKGAGADQVTIYRTLTSFVEKGILKQVDLRRGSVFFELNDHHHHLVCKGCGTIEAFEVCDVSEIASRVLKRSKLFSIADDHSLEIFGFCKKCVRA